MLSFDRQYMLEVSRWTLSPGLAIFLPAFALHLVGNGPRDALDPKTVLQHQGKTGRRAAKVRHKSVQDHPPSSRILCQDDPPV